MCIIRLTSNFYANVFVSTLSKLTQTTFILDSLMTDRAKQQIGSFNKSLILGYVTDVHSGIRFY